MAGLLGSVAASPVERALAASSAYAVFVLGCERSRLGKNVLRRDMSILRFVLLGWPARYVNCLPVTEILADVLHVCESFTVSKNGPHANLEDQCPCFPRRPSYLMGVCHHASTAHGPGSTENSLVDSTIWYLRVAETCVFRALRYVSAAIPRQRNDACYSVAVFYGRREKLQHEVNHGFKRLVREG